MNRLKIILNIIQCFSILNLLACDSSSDEAYSALEAGGNGSSAKCEIISSSPATENAMRVASKSGTITNFSVTPNVATCKVTYYINNKIVETTTEGGLASIDSNLFDAGTNTVTAIAANQFNSASVSWTIKKNNPPGCASQSPGGTANTLSIPGTLSLTANSSDADNDTLNFVWYLNSRLSSNNFSGLISGNLASTVTFVPTIDVIGNNIVSADMYDGYDHSTCEWNINVSGDCGVASSAPSASVVRVANLGSTMSNFSVTTNSPGCTANWSLNSVPMPGTTTSNQIASSMLNPGNNILIATLGSGATAITRTWMVVKNSVPTCTSQVPSSASLILTGVGIPKTFIANGDDLNGDPLDFAWFINGNLAGSTIATSMSGNTGNGIFSANSNHVGTNTISTQISDGYDSTLCSWTTTTVDQCVVASSIPANANARISVGGLALNFSVVPNDANCAVTWKINGVALDTGNFASLYPNNSNLLNAPSPNSVTATLNNGIHSPTVKTWTITKNSIPSCLSPTPTSYTGNTVAIPASLTFGMIASDTNSDTLNFTWKVNGVADTSSLSAPTSGGNASLVSFTPSGSNIGNNVVTLEINDGYDTNVCAWNVNVSGDCAVTAESPSTSGSTRVANAGSTSNVFNLTTTTAGCLANWTLNGNSITGNSLSRQILSSQLLNGANSLMAVIPNGSSSTTKIWTILKNNLPTCSTNPSNAGPTTAGMGVAKTFTATASDSDGDSMTFTWLYNNGAAGSLIASSATGNVGTGVYTGTTSSLGFGTVSAVMDDGLDTNRCDWDVSTVDACSVSSSLPAAASLRMPAFNGTQTFGIVPNNSSCNINWSLNGNDIGSGNFFDLTSANSFLAQGANSLVATISNGIHSSVTHTWNINKNSPPTCFATTPNTTVSIDYGNAQVLSAQITNSDNDPVTYAWGLNGGSPGLFSAITSGSGNMVTAATATLTPAFANIGAGQTASVVFSDGYDSGQCSWTVDVQDPNQVQISSCLPAENPAVIYSQGSNSTRLFTVSATGPNLSYQWKLDGSNIGSNSSTHSFSAGAISVGTHAVKVIVTDQYANTQECAWNMKRNSPPSINTYNPVISGAYRLRIFDTLNLGVTASDANADSLTYSWTINSGLNSTVLSSGLPSSAFIPNGITGYLGTNTIVVSVSDGHESSTQTWNVEGNYFSTECNSIYNGPATGPGATGGKICTLVGIPGVGSGFDPLNNQGLIRIQPTHLITDDTNNIIFSDQYSHSVFFYNRTASAISRFGKTLPAGRMVAILGNGLNGKNDDLSFNTDFKLSTPLGLAYDSINQKLFVADNTNNRVVMMDNTGQALTVFGNGGTTQNATTNAEGGTGTTLTCNSPQDLLIISNWLYVTCYGMHAIKKLDIDPASPTYMKGYMVIGSLSATSTVLAGNSDGTPGTTGAATANGPIALAKDGDNNLYWSEWTTTRIRMLNLSASNKSFFPLRSISAAFFVGAGDMATSGFLAAPSSVSTRASTSALAPDTLYLFGPTKVATNTCVHYRVQSRKATNAALATSNLTVNLSAGGVGTLYSDAGCTSTTASVTINSGSAEQNFYYKRASGTGGITLTASGLSTVNLAVTVSAAGSTATKLLLYGPSVFEYSTCTKFTLQVQDAANAPTTSSINRNIRLATDNTGNFYSDATCTGTPINSVSLVANTTREAYFYFAKTTVAPAGQVVSLFGNANSSLYNPGGQSSLTLRQPRGLAIDYTGSTINGFFVSTNNTTSADSNHRIVYVNNTTINRTLGGTLLYAYNQGSTLGANHGGAAIAGITSAGFNSDDSLANTVKLYYPWGMALDYTTNTLLFADNLNYRLRAIDLNTPSGNVSTIMGQGRLRAGFIGDSSMAATDSYLNGPSRATFDNSARKMYIGDSSNGRIRRLNMLTGEFDTFIGRGFGDASVDPEDPFFVYTRSIRGITMVTSGSNKFLVYTDTQGTVAANTTCLVRAYNFGSATASIFGVSIPANKVGTIAGDFTLGCGAFNGTGAGTSRRLYYPEDVIYDGTNLYVIAFNDHCILKLAADGTMSAVAGSCGVTGNVDGQSPTVAALRFPMALVPDLDNIGNFFIADQIDQNNGRVKYVNTSSTPINVGGTSAPGYTGVNTSRIQTIWNLIPQGGSQSRINGLATFGNLVCWSAGLVGDGNIGPHAVYCADKSTGTVTRLAGPNEQTTNYIRGGAPLGREQENIPAVSAYLAAPYGLTFDSEGNLYIIERSSHTVRMLRRWF
jgi:hypothetical protein